MKKFALLSAFLFTTIQLVAQDCTNYYYLQKNKTVEFTSYDEKGKAIRKSVSKVSDVTTANGTMTAIVVSESFDENGKSRGKLSLSYKCNGGALVMNLNFDDPKKQGKAAKSDNVVNTSTSSMEYPSGMKVGDHLKDVVMQMEESIGNGKTVVGTSKITDRIVVAKENVTTTAGSWTCLKITYKTTSTVKGFDMPPQTVTTTEWYVPNFGIVKTELFGTLMELTSLK